MMHAADTATASAFPEAKELRQGRDADSGISSQSDGNDSDLDGLLLSRKLEYNLRTRTLVNRIETEIKKNSPRTPKPKSKPAPLSKYRRRTANTRERTRMKDINAAFDHLKKVLPNIEKGSGTQMTKITTLRLALNYISALREILGYTSEAPYESGSEMSSSDASGELSSDGNSTGVPSVSSGDEVCRSPEDGDLLDMDLLAEDPSGLLPLDPESLLL
ncbi:hypothetical protein CHS0354_013275 [Potamilus streckersoni]|uniref:BHLH domain-containing protein n=1 Tax=Potamilus streckersoni TaxID=2493646 RepID=A0AAE0VXV4_9BIVA|nr:hypothetical protein CHS0354_013275 [Potamilus streckersoni]